MKFILISSQTYACSCYQKRTWIGVLVFHFIEVCLNKAISWRGWQAAPSITYFSCIRTNECQHWLLGFRHVAAILAILIEPQTKTAFRLHHIVVIENVSESSLLVTGECVIVWLKLVKFLLDELVVPVCRVCDLSARGVAAPVISVVELNVYLAHFLSSSIFVLFINL